MSLTVMVTGGAGYIGSTLVPVLLSAGHRVVVLDRFYFGQDSLAAVQDKAGSKLKLVSGDVRTVDPQAFDGIDAVVDLAGISNDPACELDPALTTDINLKGALRTQENARKAGVKRFIFASSCSVYGHGEQTGLTETSPIHPVSLYAKCKAEAERALIESKGQGMVVIAPRFATVFGLSRRMRFDLAVNVMTKNAYTLGQITVDGGGKQWRPFVHVLDVADVVNAFLAMPAEKIDGHVFNVGHSDNNVRIMSLAYRVRDAVPGTQVHITPTDPDLRDYNVKFDKLGEYLPEQRFRSIEHGISEVLGALRVGHIDPDERRWYTLKQYMFLAEVERTYRDVAIDGHVLS